MATGSKYFYMATLKSATSVTDCIKANFTQSPLSEQEIEAKLKNVNVSTCIRDMCL